MKRLIKKSELIVENEIGKFYKNPSISELGGLSANFKYLYLPSLNEIYIGPDNSPEETLEGIIIYDKETRNKAPDGTRFYDTGIMDILPSHAQIVQYTVGDTLDVDPSYSEANAIFGHYFQNVFYVDTDIDSAVIQSIAKVFLNMGYDGDTYISDHYWGTQFKLKNASEGIFQNEREK